MTESFKEYATKRLEETASRMTLSDEQIKDLIVLFENEIKNTENKKENNNE